MSLELLQKDISEKSFRRIYYIYGPEPYLKRFYLKSLLDAILPDNADTDLHRRDGKNLDVESFSEDLWLFPLGERKVLLINDLPLSSSVSAFLAQEDCEVPEDTVVIVYQQTENTDKTTKGYKALNKRLQKDGLAVCVEIIDDATLSRWVVQQFRRHGCTIDGENVAYFLSVEDRNMESMLTEIAKISVYCNGAVTRDALERLCVKTVQARAYELNDLLLAKEPEKAFALLENLRALRTPPQMILGSLFSCFSNLYKLKGLAGCSEAEQCAQTGLKPFLVRRYTNRLKSVPVEHLDRLMDSCGRIDVLSKTTNADADVLVVQLVTEALEVL